MRVLIITSGSTGDVAPYTGLAVRLQQSGHDVTIATHEPFRGMVTAAGPAFTPIPGDLRQILPQARGQDGATSGTDPRALLRLMALARPLIGSLAEGIVAAVSAVRPSALLLSTLVAPLGYQVAEAYGIPYAGVFPQPLHPTREFGPVLTGGRSLGPWGNLALGHLVSAAARPIYQTAVHDLRRSLGLTRASLRTLQAAQQSQHPTFHGFSPAVVPRPADWPEAMRVTGYWWPARPAGWQPPPALTEFLAAGPPPVYFGFGSMAPGQGERLAPTVLAAARRTGHRALLQSGWSGLTAAAPDVLTIDEVPHDWLFPQVAAVVHHTGAGTTAAGLRAGVPTVAVPVLADQPFWANRLHALGAAPTPLPMSALSEPRLTAALHEATRNPHYAARAQALAARLTREDSTAEINTWLSRL
jgi:sterol 3beta-glucosyltransferase